MMPTNEISPVFLSVRNLEAHQHYKNGRGITWVKIYHRLLNNDNVLYFRLPDATKLLFIHLILLASINKNKIPYEPDWLQRRLNVLEPIEPSLRLLWEPGPPANNEDESGFIMFSDVEGIEVNPHEDRAVGHQIFASNMLSKSREREEKKRKRVVQESASNSLDESVIQEDEEGPQAADPLADYPSLAAFYPILCAMILDRHPHAKVPRSGKADAKRSLAWRKGLADMVRLDKMAAADIEGALRGVFTDGDRDSEFWADQIQSVPPLRVVRKADQPTKMARIISLYLRNSRNGSIATAHGSQRKETPEEYEERVGRETADE